MKLPFLSNPAESASSWRWPTCGETRTLSFRRGGDTPALTPDPEELHSPEHWLEDESVESLVLGVRPERLFFEPGGESSSIMGRAEPDNGPPFRESRAVAVESVDPFVDFRSSMEEMVEARGLKDWESLEKLLAWYLKSNEEGTYGYIVRAFVDLLFGLELENYHCCCCCSSSSSSNSPLFSSLELGEEREEEASFSDNVSSLGV